MMNFLDSAYKQSLEKLEELSKHIPFDLYNQGKEKKMQILVADYISPLAKIDPTLLGLAVTTTGGEVFSVGDAETPFSIQSIVKLITLAVALEEHEKGEEKNFVFTRVGVESSGDAFNSVVKLETSVDGIPKNPMINAGAISVCSCISGKSVDDRFSKVVALAEKLCGGRVSLNQEVYEAESATGHRNRGLAYYMASRNIWGEVTPEFIEETLTLYFQCCSLEVNCVQLSHLGAVLSNQGVSPAGEKIIRPSHARFIRSLMVTAGMYDGSGQFAIDLGFPGKSGVGGGIVGVVPQRMGIATFSPALDPQGNSYLGKIALEKFAALQDLFLY